MKGYPVYRFSSQHSEVLPETVSEDQHFFFATGFLLAAFFAAAPFTGAFFPNGTNFFAGAFFAAIPIHSRHLRFFGLFNSHDQDTFGLGRYVLSGRLPARPSRLASKAFFCCAAPDAHGSPKDTQ